MKDYSTDELDIIYNGVGGSGENCMSGVYFIERTIIPLVLSDKKQKIKQLCYIGSSKNINKRVKDPNHIFIKLFNQLNIINDFEMSLVTIRYYYSTDYLNLEKQLIKHCSPIYNIQHNRNEQIKKY